MKTIIALLLFACSATFAQSTCNNLGRIIVIDYDRTNSNWRNQNNDFICTNSNPEACYGSNCCSNILYIDMESVNQNQRVYEWLNRNQDLICFENSYPYIEKCHYVSPNTNNYSDLLNSLNNEIIKKNFFGYTYDELRNLISDFDTYKYDRYIVLKQNINKEVELTFEQYSENNSNFSVPFIRSVAKKINLTSNDYRNCFFKFIYFVTSGKTETYLMVTFDGKEYIYDFSGEPSTGI
ncbi:hypothetical protein [Flavobacterium sp.]|uniref:hypothetical protein n=1 Tax=Flavobacterium sp. TaxID=239 RepID=UPI0035AF43EE